MANRPGRDDGRFRPAAGAAPASAAKLAGLCDRVALSLDAGIDVRRVWHGEADRHRGPLGEACRHVARAIDRGEPLDESVATAGNVLPPMFVEMTRAGERTGTLTHVYRRLATHYERRAARAREFRSAIAWPMMQLTAALAVVGLMIGIGGALTDGRGNPIDFLGLGLVGTRGLVIYVNTLVGLALVGGLGWLALVRNPAWSARLRAAMTRVPILGPCLEKFALARIAWALHLALNVDLDIRRVAAIALNASDNGHYQRHTDAVIASLGRGQPLSTACGLTGVFPRPFIDSLEVAEESGQLVESMQRLSRRYEEEAEHAVETLSRIAAAGVWLLVATLVIVLIFRLFSFYTGVLNDALEGL